MMYVYTSNNILYCVCACVYLHRFRCPAYYIIIIHDRRRNEKTTRILNYIIVIRRAHILLLYSILVSSAARHSRIEHQRERKITAYNM